MPSATLSKVLPKRLTHLGTADAALALMVIAVVGLMIVPLPTWLLDILLAINISLSVGVLLVVLYIPNALSVSTFPTLLLITTLLRLALNVSSSRLILLQADAGEVIRAFGNFVVRGNYVVGAVVFLILTIIQFVVIAKGSERVAEVGARFVLDAMPGKQMAIDAELRAGSIDGLEAKFRRHQLARESQFYGAMDGAIKFVKGDVIASLVITVVNILGGLAIGVGQREMEAVAALKRYGLLTIGDGLVTQIPALVLSTAAGILVTRVASEDPDTSLGQELSGQLFGTPKAIQVAGAFVLLLAVVPGLPAFPFLLIGSSLLILSRMRVRQLRKQRDEEEQRAGQPRTVPRGHRGPRFVPIVTPWAVHVGTDLAYLIEDERRGEEIIRPGLRSKIIQLREGVFANLGVPLPPAAVQPAEELPPRRVVVSVFEVPFRVADVPHEVDDDERVLAIERFLLAALLERAADFVGIAETQMLLDQLEQFAPPLPRQVVPKPISLALLTDILRRLVEEGVSVRDLRAILEALATAPPTDKDPLSLAELVRSHLRRATTFQLTGGTTSLAVYMLDPEVEETVRGAIQRTASGSFLALSPSAAREILTAIRNVVTSNPPPAGRPLVLLTQPDVRRFVRKLVDSEFPEMRVISFAELLPEISLKPLGRASLAGTG
ncbi:MAG: EscV/YscV/HrcV family type III secretion system export apparatus protein [Sorangium cellulosum]|nr:MAG: EscV/YscV/HrcV family type III secretion system export apparatus protein [Sorangium cellulosum]